MFNEEIRGIAVVDDGHGDGGKGKVVHHISVEADIIARGTGGIMRGIPSSSMTGRWLSI